MASQSDAPSKHSRRHGNVKTGVEEGVPAFTCNLNRAKEKKDYKVSLHFLVFAALYYKLVSTECVSGKLIQF